MKLIDILNKFYETTKFGAEESAYSDFLKTLTVKDFEKIKEYGELLINVADGQIDRRNKASEKRIMRELILAKIESLKYEIEEYEEIYGADWEKFNASDASGGNFDDAYSLGMEHGETYGKLSLLNELLKSLRD